MSKDRWMRKSAVLILVATGCFPAVAMAAIHIKLQVNSNSNPPTLEVSDNDSRCTDGALDCIEVPKGSWHNLIFELDDACEEKGPAYQLSSFRIAMKEKDWPTATNPLTSEVAGDFDADPLTGYIRLGAGDNKKSKDRIKFKDKNQSAYSVYYEIVATACVGSGEAKLDPVIKNGGGGNP